MKSNYKIMFALVTAMSSSIASFAQTKEWKTEKSKDGVDVKYRVTTNAQKEQVAEYVASATYLVNIDKLSSIMNDVSKHKLIWGSKSSTKIKSVSQNESIIYYFYEGSWPFKSSDLAATMVYSENPALKTKTFTITAEPKMYEDKGVKRLHYYNLTYTFKDMEDGKTSIVLTSIFTPAYKVPDFLISSWFPEGPSEYISKLVNLSK